MRRHLSAWLVLITVVSVASEANADDFEDTIQSLVIRGQVDLAQKKMEATGDAGHSKSVRANFLYAQCLIFSGRFDEAKPILRRCAESEDTDYSRVPYHASNMLKDLPLMKRKFKEYDELNKLGYTGLVLTDGNIVEQVVKGSSAETAGILPGDKFLKIDGHPVRKDVDQTLKMIRGESGTSLSIVYERNGESHNCKLTRASSLHEMNKATFSIEGWVEPSESSDTKERKPSK